MGVKVALTNNDHTPRNSFAAHIIRRRNDPLINFEPTSDMLCSRSGFAVSQRSCHRSLQGMLLFAD